MNNFNNEPYNVKMYSGDEVLEYLRKSRSDDPLLTDVEVLQKHEDILKEYAEKNINGEIPRENIFREVASSETIEGRPEMLKILKLIESPKIKAILVVEIERLSRGDLEDAGRLIKILRYTNTKVITPQRTYDLRDEYDRDYFERELKRGNDYLEYTKKILNRGKLSAVRKGNYIGTFPPYGFDKYHYHEGKEKCCKLVENKDESVIVKMVFDWYANEGLSFVKIADRLNEMNVKPRHTDYWKPENFKEMVSNVHYIGKVRWNYRQTEKFIEDGEVIKRNTRKSITEYLIFEGKHDGFIDEELFEKVQKRRGQNPKLRKSDDLRNPLAGLLWCSKCHRALRMRVYNNPDGTMKMPNRYECMSGKHCETGTTKQADVIERVCDTLEACIEDFEVRLKNNKGNGEKLKIDLILSLERRLQELEKQEMKQWEKFSMDGMPKHIFEQLNEKVLNEKEDVKNAICKAKQTMPKDIDYKEKIVTFKKTLDALKDDSIDAGTKNKYLKAIIERIEYTRERPSRITKKEAEKKGIEYPQHNYGWMDHPFELDVTLKE